jgi:hypothetical protein
VTWRPLGSSTRAVVLAGTATVTVNNGPALAQRTKIRPYGVGTAPSAHRRLPRCGATVKVW